MQHPDITSALRTGYPVNQSPENRDTPEAREEYMEENAGKVVGWLRLNYPELLEEFMELYRGDYLDWLN